MVERENNNLQGEGGGNSSYIEESSSELSAMPIVVSAKDAAFATKPSDPKK